jgi:hypothetical protein
MSSKNFSILNVTGDKIIRLTFHSTAPRAPFSRETTPLMFRGVRLAMRTYASHIAQAPHHPSRGTRHGLSILAIARRGDRGGEVMSQKPKEAELWEGML